MKSIVLVIGRSERSERSEEDHRVIQTSGYVHRLGEERVHMHLGEIDAPLLYTPEAGLNQLVAHLSCPPKTHEVEPEVFILYNYIEFLSLIKNVYYTRLY